MKKVCFVILHYNSLEDTQKCVSSILNMEKQEKIHIVIVDNNSPNATGKILMQLYENVDNIDVLLRDINDGFSRGNNAGCTFAIKKYTPKFLVIANNDIVFTQTDFVRIIEDTYYAQKFAVLGPDIYNPARQIHQNPLSKSIPTTKDVTRTIFLNRFMLSMFPVTYPIMNRYYRNKVSEKKDAFDFDAYQEDVCLMGACMIVSDDYYSERGKVFTPETTFYYEENIMMLWCRANKAKVIYEPKLKVLHMEGSATETVGENLKERVRFRMKRILESAIIYKDFLRETGYEETVTNQYRL